MRKRCGWSEKLKGCGFRLTRAREAIIDTLRNTEEHLSAEDIYLAIHKHHHHHHHLICMKCQKIIDYFDFIDDEIDYLKAVTKGLSKQYNFDIKGHLIRFHGLCEQCGEQKK